jgi:LysM repeat protein
MARRSAILLVSLGLVAACGGGASPTPAPTPVPTPVPTEVLAPTAEPTATATARPAASPTATPAAGKRYRVRQGDTMWAIAIRFGVSLADLKAANPDVDPRAMRVGTVLVIPGR